MVARDPMNKGSAILNPLIAETEDEKALFRKGEGIFCFLDFIFTVRWLHRQPFSVLGEKISKVSCFFLVYLLIRK